VPSWNFSDALAIQLLDLAETCNGSNVIISLIAAAREKPTK